MARIKERRRRRRIDVALPIRIEYNKEKILSETKDISVLGTYLEADKEIPLGAVLDIEIEIPKRGQAKQIKCAGVAFRSQPAGSAGLKRQYGTAIFFRSFLKRGEEELSEYIDSVLSQEERKGKIYMRERKQKQSKRKGGKQ